MQISKYNRILAAFLLAGIAIFAACSRQPALRSTAEISGSVFTSSPLQVSPTPWASSTPVSTPLPSEQPAKSPILSPSPATPSVVPSAGPEKVREAEALYEQGYAHYNEFKYDEAIKFYNRALAADPYCYKAFTGKGIALCFKGSYKEGMELIKKALDIKPGYAPSNYNYALGYKLQKDYNNALLWFEKAIALDSKDTWSYYGISTIYADRNNVEKSLEYLKKAIDLEPEVKGVAKSQDHFARMRSNPDFVKLTQ